MLIGQVIDTNSSWIASKLNEEGIWVKQRLAVGDNREDIIQALDQVKRGAQIILMTGGLGPTADDITKVVLCDYFDGKLVVNNDALANVKYIFETVLKRPLIDRNLKQAEVPDVCTVINNKRGTAPGMWFEKNGKIFVSMPGVPYEMKGMMIDDVLPGLKKHFTTPFILHRTLLTAGIGESFLANTCENFESSLQDNIKLAYLPNYGMVRLRLTGIGDNLEILQKTLDEKFSILKNLVREWMVTDEDISIQQHVARLLKQRKKTLGTAESCTGGYIAHLLTKDAGASSFFKGTVVSYSNDVKEDVLHVKKETLVNAGAVSEEAVQQMVKGALDILKSDYALATSGIMGPDGGTSMKPVGTVWIAVGNTEKTETKKFSFRFDRQRNIELTANSALHMITKFITSQNH